MLAEAEAQIATLDEALDSGSNDAALWTFTTLSGIFQDLGRLVREEPIPAELDQQKLAASIQTALLAVAEGSRCLQAGEYRLPHTDSIILLLALDDIRLIMNATHDGSSTPEVA